MSFVLFSSALNVLQFVGIFIAVFVVAIVNQLIYKKFSDQKKIKELNKVIKGSQSKMKTLKHDPDALNALNKDLLKASSDKMGLVMKPMLFSIVTFFVTFPVMSNLFKGFNLFIFSNPLPLIGADVGWFLTYIIASFVITMVVRKRMGVEI